MHIAIDITPLESGHAFRGVGTYTRLLVDSLKRYESKHSYSLFTRGQKIPKKADIVHYPYFDPFFLTLPLFKEKQTVVTVHDLIPLVFPDRFPAGFKGALKWQLQKISLWGAKRIIADSDSSKNDIARITGVDKARIDRIYLAPDPAFVPAKVKASKMKYFLYVGDVNWNKNVLGLLEAFAKLKGYTLILVGRAFIDTSLRETRQINSLIGVLGIERFVRRPGHVSGGELNKLYSEAVALVQPSFYEGFGLPVLEAMACGCPVVSAVNSSLAEIEGPAIHVAPDAVSIAEGMRKAVVLNRAIQTNKQFEWLTQFSWKRVARETALSYEKAVNHHTGI